MFSTEQATGCDDLTEGFIATLDEHITEENPYLRAAQENEIELATKAISDFACHQIEIETIVPIFNSAAYPLIYQTDKLATKGKGGQALFDKPGQEYGGENAIKKLMNKVRAASRHAQAQSYRIEPV